MARISTEDRRPINNRHDVIEIRHDMDKIGAVPTNKGVERPCGKMPTSLPPNPFPLNAFHAAYERCLALEAAAPNLQTPTDCPPPILCARLLGHLLRLAPAGKGQGQAQCEIASATDDITLMKLALHYMKNFVRVFKRNSGPTPPPSEYPSCPSFEDVSQYTVAIIEEGGVDYCVAQTAAMHRDDNRCMLTGKRDYKHGGIGIVEATHIIPDAANHNIQQEGKKQFYSAGVWSTLSMLTDLDIAQLLTGKLIHRLENMMMLDLHCHRFFDELYLWLKPVEGLPNTYSVHEARQGLKAGLGIPDIVTFSTIAGLPLPHPSLLVVHALCSEMAWMSGAAEYIMDLEKRMDETSVLANDGSTADVLIQALSLVEPY